MGFGSVEEGEPRLILGKQHKMGLIGHIVGLTKLSRSGLGGPTNGLWALAVLRKGSLD